MNAEPDTMDAADEPMQDAEVLTVLLERHDAWIAAVANIGQAAGGRDRLITAEIALAQLEELAPRAGLLLADALRGHAPDFRSELLQLLNVPVVTPAGEEAETVEALEDLEVIAELPLPPAVEEVAAHAPEIKELVTTPIALPVKLEIVQPVTLPLPPPVPVTEATMAMLKASLSGELKSAPVSAITKAQHKALGSLRKMLGGVPPDLKTRGEILSVLKQVELTIAEVRTWEHLGRRGRRLLVEGVAARVRAIQDAEGSVKDIQYLDRVHERTAKVMRELRKETTDGKLDRVAWGLALKHESQSGSWLEDARLLQRELDDELGIAPTASLPPQRFNVDDAFRRLREDVLLLPVDQLCTRIRELLANGVAETDKRFVKLLEPRLPEIVGERSLARVTRAVAGALATEDKDEDIVRTIDAGWYGFAHTAGMNAVIVGGDGRSERAVVLQSAFRFARLDWPDIPKNSPGKANALVGQVRNGNYQIVICLQPFISHKLTDQLFEVDVPGTTVVLAQGYGMVQIKLAFERYLPRPLQLRKAAC